MTETRAVGYQLWRTAGISGDGMDGTGGISGDGTGGISGVGLSQNLPGADGCPDMEVWQCWAKEIPQLGLHE